MQVVTVVAAAIVRTCSMSGLVLCALQPPCLFDRQSPPFDIVSI